MDFLDRSTIIPIKCLNWVSWHYLHIKYKPESIGSTQYISSYFEIPKWNGKYIWHPVIDFGHLIHYHRTKYFGGTKSYQSVYKEKKIFYGEEFLLTTSCDFHFEDYPFDSHVCNLEIGDQNLTTRNMIMSPPRITHGNLLHNLGDKPITFDDLPYPFEFQLEAIPSFHKTDPILDTSYSFTGVAIRMKRKSLGELITGYYYPTSAFVLLSMISFLIKSDLVSLGVYNNLKYSCMNEMINNYLCHQVPGRMGMIVTLYLISANVYNSVKAPAGRGFSYIELWMIGSQFPILLALFEYGFVLFLKKINNQITDDRIKMLDFATLIISILSFVTFSTFYLITLWMKGLF